jgi:hypothetical protein
MEKITMLTLRTKRALLGSLVKTFLVKVVLLMVCLWTLFNTTSKNERKNLNVINQNIKNAAVR